MRVLSLRVLSLRSRPYAALGPNLSRCAFCAVPQSAQVPIRSLETLSFTGATRKAQHVFLLQFLLVSPNEPKFTGPETGIRKQVTRKADGKLTVRKSDPRELSLWAVDFKMAVWSSKTGSGLNYLCTFPPDRLG